MISELLIGRYRRTVGSHGSATAGSFQSVRWPFDCQESVNDEGTKKKNQNGEGCVEKASFLDLVSKMTSDREHALGTFPSTVTPPFLG
jgi:hypothetical protein